MKIKNINGTSQAKCSCGSWLKHWQNFSGELECAWLANRRGC